MEQKEINSQSMLRVGTILRGIYRIDSYLSSGGFGNTYVATNIEFDERVAIKEFFMKGITQRDDNQTTVSVSNSENTDCFQQQKNKFKKEAHRLRKLNNEHIVKVYDLFEENGTAYYVMDYVDGEDLAERLKRTNSPLSEQEVYQILPQILDGLKAIHDEGLCHLDIKPSNIMVDKGGNVKLIDFGASKQLENNGLTTTNGPTAFSQTPGYAPREQIEQNIDKIGPWTDIYALGATLYNLLTKKHPPLPSDIDDDMSEDKHNALPFPKGVGEIKFIVLKMMKTNRLQRPQNVDAIEIKQAPAFDSHKVKNGNWVEAPWSTNEKDEQTIIGKETETDEIVDKEEKAYINVLRSHPDMVKSAKKGDTTAQYELALWFEKHAKDYSYRKEAYKWYLSAATNGHSAALFKLGNCYEKEFGVKKDISTALYYYQKAAAQGNSLAMDSVNRLKHDSEKDASGCPDATATGHEALKHDPEKGVSGWGGCLRFFISFFTTFYLLDNVIAQDWLNPGVTVLGFLIDRGHVIGAVALLFGFLGVHWADRFFGSNGLG